MRWSVASAWEAVCRGRWRGSAQPSLRRGRSRGGRGGGRGGRAAVRGRERGSEKKRGRRTSRSLPSAPSRKVPSRPGRADAVRRFVGNHSFRVVSQHRAPERQQKRSGASVALALEPQNGNRTRQIANALGSCSCCSPQELLEAAEAPSFKQAAEELLGADSDLRKGEGRVSDLLRPSVLNEPGSVLVDGSEERGRRNDGTLRVAQAHAVLAISCGIPFSTSQAELSSMERKRVGDWTLRVAHAYAAFEMFCGSPLSTIQAALLSTALKTAEFRSQSLARA